MLATCLLAKTPTQPSSMAPILEFPEGRYLGLGHYITADNQRGTYSSFADVKTSSWQVNYLREYGNEAYGVDFAFSDNGQFTVTLLAYINNELDAIYFGDGYCQSVQCHISVDMQDRIFEETVTFLTDEKKIYRLGSISRIDDYGYPTFAMSWEESLMSVDLDDSFLIEPKPPKKNR